MCDIDVSELVQKKTLERRMKSRFLENSKSVDMFPQTEKALKIAQIWQKNTGKWRVDIKMKVSRHIETVALLSRADGGR